MAPGKRCIVTGCIDGPHSKRSRFLFPVNDEERCKKWIAFCGNQAVKNCCKETLKKYTICSDHFESKYILEHQVRLTLSTAAVPTLKCSTNGQPKTDSNFTANIETEQIVLNEASEPGTSSHLTIKRSVSQSRIFLLRHFQLKRAEITSRKSGLLKHVCKTAMSLMKSRKKSLLSKDELHSVQKKSGGRRWSADDKAFALSFYKKSPESYRMFRKLIDLPSPKILLKALNNIDMECGINANIDEYLRKKVASLGQKSRYCIVMFGEMSLQEGLVYNQGKDKIDGYEDYGHIGRTNRCANKALVFMVKGINRKWKQPYAFYFIRNLNAPKLSCLLHYVISKIQNIGLIPVATVCDHLAVNVKALQMLADNVKERPGPFFQVNKKDIVYCFDAPYLLKSFRDRFLENDIRFQVEKDKWGTAQWHHVEEYFKKDGEYYKLAYRLTEHHIHPSGTSKQNVKLAAQTFSNTVQGGMGYMVKAKMLPPEAENTAQLIKLMDNLFDSFNGHTRKVFDGKSLRCWLTKTSLHEDFWDSALPILEQMQFLSKNGKKVLHAPCQLGWIHNLRAIKKLWVQLQEEGIFYLNLRHLNLDSLRNLFGSIRQFGDNPTAAQFVAAFKTSIVNNLSLSFAVRNLNCEADDSSVLSNLKSFLKNSLRKGNLLCKENLALSRSTLPLLNIHEDKQNLILKFSEADVIDVAKQSTEDVASYILSKIVIVMDCQECLAKSRKTEGSVVPDAMQPSEEFINFIATSTKIMLQNAWNIFHNQRVQELLLVAAISGKMENMIIGCGEHKKVLSLNVLNFLGRILIYNRCKKLNKIVNKKYKGKNRLKK